MYSIVWQLRARAGREREFEQAYGPRGEWLELFATGEGYLGTELLRDVGQEGRYLVIDRWASREHYRAFQEARRAEYDALDERCEHMTEEDILVGSFECVEGE